MNINGQLYGLYSLKGTFSEGRLLKAGFTKKAIGRAVSSRGLIRISEGFYKVNEQIARKLLKVTESDLNPGQEVFRYKDGVIKSMQVVKDKGSSVSLVDPEKEEVQNSDEKEVLTRDEIEKSLGSDQ
jgi:hypothetical protein